MGEAWPERPDLVVLATHSGRIALLEVAVPYDTALERRFNDKTVQYQALAERLRQPEHGFEVSVAAIIVGAAGFVHRQAVAQLLGALEDIADIKRSEARRIMEVANIAAVRGSHRLWCERGKRRAQAEAQAAAAAAAAGDAAAAAGGETAAAAAAAGMEA